MKYKWVLHPERDVYGDGSTVAEGYFNEFSEYPNCIIRSYSKHYRVEIFNAKGTIIDIHYDNVELRRLKRKLLKKQKKGLITNEQHTKIYLFAVCNMVELRNVF